MKKIFIFMLLLAMVFSLGVSFTFAGGGQNCIGHQGTNETGEGFTTQNLYRLNQP